MFDVMNFRPCFYAPCSCPSAALREVCFIPASRSVKVNGDFICSSFLKKFFLETKHRCGFFLEVFGLKTLPEYLMQCNLLPESDDPDECVGYREVREAKLKAQKPSNFSAPFMYV